MDISERVLPVFFARGRMLATQIAGCSEGLMNFEQIFYASLYNIGLGNNH